MFVWVGAAQDFSHFLRLSDCFICTKSDLFKKKKRNVKKSTNFVKTSIRFFTNFIKVNISHIYTQHKRKRKAALTNFVKLVTFPNLAYISIVKRSAFCDHFYSYKATEIAFFKKSEFSFRQKYETQNQSNSGVVSDGLTKVFHTNSKQQSTFRRLDIETI